MRAAAASASVLMTLICCSVAAGHSGVVLSGSTISYFAPDRGSVSTATLSRAEGDTIEISDPTALGGVTPGDCVPITETRVRCPAEGITDLSVSLGPEDDSVVNLVALAAQLTGGSGNDTLTGGPASDRLNGGTGSDSLDGAAGDDRLIDTSDAGDRLHGGQGSDYIASADDRADQISCGEGHDTVVADLADAVTDEAAGACESVSRVVPGAGPAAPLAGDDLTPPELSSLRVTPANPRVTRRRRWATVSWRLSEPGSTALGLWRALPGRRVGARCAPGRAGPRRRRCTALRFVLGMRVVGAAGKNRAELSLYRRRRALPAGRYRLRARATDAAGNVSGYALKGLRIRR